MPRTAEPIDRRIQRNIVTDANGCWVWQGATSAAGYGRIATPRGRRQPRRSQYVHRIAYETWVGPIPDGLALDHLCHNRACCNPAHLEPVTFSENLRRSPQSVANRAKSHCIHGHEFTPENTRLVPKGRRCKACERRRAAESYRRRT